MVNARDGAKWIPASTTRISRVALVLLPVINLWLFVA